MIDRHFGLDLPASRFAWNVLLLSVGVLVPMAAAYVLFRPGVTGMLAQGGSAAVWLLGRQILTNGLPVIFVATWIGFVLHGSWRRMGAPWRFGTVLVLCDAPLRLAAFIVLHAAIYVLSADWFGSFGGDRLRAVEVVAPTLARAAGFENLSGPYLYAMLLAALPAQGATIVDLIEGRVGRVVAVAWALAIAIILNVVWIAIATAVLTAVPAR